MMTKLAVFFLVCMILGYSVTSSWTIYDNHRTYKNQFHNAQMAETKACHDAGHGDSGWITFYRSNGTKGEKRFVCNHKLGDMNDYGIYLIDPPGCNTEMVENCSKILDRK